MNNEDSESDEIEILEFRGTKIEIQNEKKKVLKILIEAEMHSKWT